MTIGEASGTATEDSKLENLGGEQNQEINNMVDSDDESEIDYRIVYQVTPDDNQESECSSKKAGKHALAPNNAELDSNPVHDTKVNEGSSEKAGKLVNDNVGTKCEDEERKSEADREVGEPRRSHRTNKGTHPNPHNLPRSTLSQNQTEVVDPASFQEFSRAVAMLGESLGKTILAGWSEMNKK